MIDHMRPLKTIKMSDMIQAYIMDQVKCFYLFNKHSTTKLNSIQYSHVLCREDTNLGGAVSWAPSYVSEIFPQIIQDVSVILCLEYSIKREMDHLSVKVDQYSEILQGTETNLLPLSKGFQKLLLATSFLNK